jgi:hypothetical protein
LRASDNNRLKIDVLADGTTGDISIRGVEALFEAATREGILPLAPTVIVGVDNIQARWAVQQEWPAHFYIGATDNTSAVLTTHQPGQPCAGCAHPHPLPPPGPGEYVPTISFISFWAGLMQALALLSPPGPARRITVYPFALGSATWNYPAVLPYGARCAIDCTASRAHHVARNHGT